MIAVALKGLAGRKLRATLSALAIVLGVAMVSGTYILTDTISSAFRTAIAEAHAGTSAVISGKEIVGYDEGGHPTLPAALLERVRALPEVEAAAGTVSDSAKLVDRQGRLIQSSLGWTFAFSYDPGGERFNPTALVAGRWPAGPREVVIDKGTAGRKGFAVGHEIGVLVRGPVREFRIVGLARFGSIDSIGGASFAVFDTVTAQALFGKRGRFDEISVAARPGVSPQQLVRKIAPILPASARVRTAQAKIDEERKEIEEGIGFVRKFLLAFGGIALFVGVFVIFNTLSITVAQRAREFATLRMIGASRRQVLASVVLEALVVGVLASAAGLVLGLGLAKGLNALFVSFGIDLPRSGTIFAARTVVVSLLVGVVVTLLAGLAPAIRATRVPPVAAVREGATLPSRLAPLVPWIALLTTALGIVALAYGMFGSGLGATQRLRAVGLGCVALFAGVALISPRLVVPLALVLGLPARRLGGAAGRLARENSMRNPSRTAVTAAALMIGLALVTLVGVLGAGVSESVGRMIERQLRADYVVTSQSGFEPFAVAAGEAVARAPGVELAADVREDDALVDGSEKEVTGIDPGSLDELYDFAWKEGSNAVLDELGPNEAIVTEDLADTHGLSVGSRLTIQSPSGGHAEFVVRGIYRPPSLLGDVSIPLRTFDRLFPRAQNLYTFVNVRSAAAVGAVERTLAPFPDAKLETRDEFVSRMQDHVTQLLNLLYVLLALSVIVSLLGMVNTLALSVFERTRELGMLRAIGMTRRQVRRMVRHESVITALIGAALGMPLGIFLAALVGRALADEGMVFALPVGTLTAFTAVAVIAGLLAAILPARRAARLDVLEALQYE